LAERGPKGLTLHRDPFDSSERFGDFMNALRSNTYLDYTLDFRKNSWP
jgi:hypothetical protein